MSIIPQKTREKMLDHRTVYALYQRADKNHWQVEPEIPKPTWHVCFSTLLSCPGAPARWPRSSLLHTVGNVVARSSGTASYKLSHQRTKESSLSQLRFEKAQTRTLNGQLLSRARLRGRKGMIGPAWDITHPWDQWLGLFLKGIEVQTQPQKKIAVRNEDIPFFVYSTPVKRAKIYTFKFMQFFNCLLCTGFMNEAEMSSPSTTAWSKSLCQATRSFLCYV